MDLSQLITIKKMGPINPSLSSSNVEGIEKVAHMFIHTHLGI